MLDKRFMSVLIIFILAQLISCQSKDRKYIQYLTNDSTKYWDIYERPEWDLTRKRLIVVYGVDNNRTCWAFSKNGQWATYRVNRKGYLLDKYSIAGDLFYADEWSLSGDTLVKGMGIYWINKCSEDTLELQEQHSPSIVFKLIASKNQYKKICSDGDCQ